MISNIYSGVFAIGIIAFILTIFEIIAFHTFINKNMKKGIEYMENKILNTTLNNILPVKDVNDAINLARTIDAYKKHVENRYLRYKNSISRYPDEILFINVIEICDLSSVLSPTLIFPFKLQNGPILTLLPKVTLSEM